MSRKCYQTLVAGKEERKLCPVMLMTIATGTQERKPCPVNVIEHVCNHKNLIRINPKMLHHKKLFYHKHDNKHRTTDWLIDSLIE